MAAPGVVGDKINEFLHGADKQAGGNKTHSQTN